MPELPEVEVTRLSLVDRLAGATVLGARLGKPLRWPLGCAVASLSGRVVGTLQRRGKYLWMPLGAASSDAKPVIPADPVDATDPAADPAAAADGGLLLHLGMSGSLNLSPAVSPPAEPGKHDHFDLHTSRGSLRLTDPRRFGAVVWSGGLNLNPAAALLAKLGPEPFDPALTGLSFHAALQRRRTPIKVALLSGELVVGAGNIYASEALYRAGIDPRLPCDALSRPRAERLLWQVRQTLAQAISLGGSTLRDFRDAHGISGAFQSQAQVYGRAGEPCGRCGKPIRRLLQGQRATFWCAGCQRR